MEAFSNAGESNLVFIDVYKRQVWEVRPERVKVPYVKSELQLAGSRVPRDTRNLVGRQGCLLYTSYSPGGILNAFAAAPNSYAARHLVFIVYGVDYQGI